MSDLALPVAPSGQVRWRSIVLPVEHGGWGLLFEPALIGILAMPSVPGVAVLLAVVCGFLLRQPLRILAMTSSPARRAAAVRASLLLGAGTLSMVAAAVSLGRWALLVPLVLAAPFALVQFASDVRRKSRTLLVELSGAAAMAASAAAIPLASGGSYRFAAALAALASMRSATAILYVRARLRGRGSVPSILTHLFALVVALVLATHGWGPRLAVVAFTLLLARAAAGLHFERPLPARSIGLREVGWGSCTAILIGAGAHL